MAFLWGVYGFFLLTGFVLAAVRLASQTAQRFFLYLTLVPVILVVVGYPEAAVVLLVVCGLFAWGLIGPEGPLESQKTALVAELLRLREATRNDPDARLFCLQRIAEIYEALEESELALKYYRQARECKDAHRLAYKVTQLELEVRTWKPPSNSLAQTLRACPRCELTESRLAYACRHCGQVFYPDSKTWYAASFNRWYEKAGVTAAAVPGAIFIPFLFILGPVLYSLLWAVWAIGLRARRAA